MPGQKSNPFLTLRVNADSALARKAMLEGAEHYVVPVVMMVEGVHNGSGGPIFYSNEVLSHHPEAWNSKPIVVYHPELHGKSVSASDPVILSNRKIGVLLNTTFEDGKLKSEAWINIEKARAVDERVIQAIENGQMMEVSTGITGAITESDGIWNGETYVATMEYQIPDHLAVLPDQVGACSTQDGAGLMRNQDGKQVLDIEKIRNIAHSDVVESLRNQIAERFEGPNQFTFIEDFEGGDVVFGRHLPDRSGPEYFRIGFSVNGNKVALSEGTPTPVLRRVQYVSASPDAITQNQKSAMDKKQLISAILQLENTGLAQTDAEFLETLPEGQLQKMHDSYVANAKVFAEMESKVKQFENAAIAAAAANKATAAAAANKAPEPVTLEQLVNSAPSEVAEAFKYGVRVANQARVGHITTILANESNTFTKEDLAKMPIETLERIANLAKKEAEKSYLELPFGGRVDFSGQGPVANAGGHVEEPLEIPDMFAPRKAN